MFAYKKIFLVLALSFVSAASWANESLTTVALINGLNQVVQMAGNRSVGTDASGADQSIDLSGGLEGGSGEGASAGNGITFDKLVQLYKASGGLFVHAYGINLISIRENPTITWLFYIVLLAMFMLGITQRWWAINQGGGDWFNELAAFFLKFLAGIFLVHNTALVYAIIASLQLGLFTIVGSAMATPAGQRMLEMSYNTNYELNQLSLIIQKFSSEAAQDYITIPLSGDAQLAEKSLEIAQTWYDAIVASGAASGGITEVPDAAANGIDFSEQGDVEVPFNFLSSISGALSEYVSIMAAPGASSNGASGADLGPVNTISVGGEGSGSLFNKIETAIAEEKALLFPEGSGDDINAGLNSAEKQTLFKRIEKKVSSATDEWMQDNFEEQFKDGSFESRNSNRGVGELESLYNDAKRNAEGAARQEGLQGVEKMFYKMNQWLTSVFPKWIALFALSLFGIFMEGALFFLWLAYPLWFYPPTSKAFTGLFTATLVTALYPMAFLMLVVVFDALYVNVGEFLLNAGDGINPSVF